MAAQPIPNRRIFSASMTVNTARCVVVFSSSSHTPEQCQEVLHAIKFPFCSKLSMTRSGPTYLLMSVNIATDIILWTNMIEIQDRRCCYTIPPAQSVSLHFSFNVQHAHSDRSSHINFTIYKGGMYCLLPRHTSQIDKQDDDLNQYRWPALCRALECV